MPNAATYQCPNCGSVASFDPSSGRVVCRSCGTAFADDEVRTGIPLAEVPLAARDTEHARTAEDFLPRAPWELGVADVENTVSYSCPACAARIIADQSTVATSCPYCGNNLLVQGIATPQNIPEQLLPFSVTREEAQERLRGHFGRAWYLPRSFAAEIAHIQSVYVPFYLYDLRVWGNAAYIMDESRDGDGRFRAIRLSEYAGFVAVAVDASSKMPDNLQAPTKLSHSTVGPSKASTLKVGSISSSKSYTDTSALPPLRRLATSRGHLAAWPSDVVR